MEYLSNIKENPDENLHIKMLQTLHLLLNPKLIDYNSLEFIEKVILNFWIKYFRWKHFLALPYLLSDVQLQKHNHSQHKFSSPFPTHRHLFRQPHQSFQQFGQWVLEKWGEKCLEWENFTKLRYLQVFKLTI